MLDVAGAEDLAQALSAKARGAANLDSLTASTELSVFVLFSSVATAFGLGQGPYAAANAYLDALAQNRCARGLPATSVAWGAWEGEGMAAGEGVEQVMRLYGLGYIAPEPALKVLEGALLREETLTAVADIRWEECAWMLTASRRMPLIEDLSEVRSALAGASEADVQATVLKLWERLRRTPAEERHELLLKLVQTEVAGVMGLSPQDAIDARRPFKDLGFDSLMAIELRKRLVDTTGLALPAGLVFNHPTIATLADHLLERLTDRGAALPGSALHELEQFELALDGSSMEEDERVAVQKRLQALIATLSEAGGARTGATIAQEIDSASADEVIDFIDKQLGVL